MFLLDWMFSTTYETGIWWTRYDRYWDVLFANVFILFIKIFYRTWVTWEGTHTIPLNAFTADSTWLLTSTILSMSMLGCFTRLCTTEACYDIRTTLNMRVLLCHQYIFSCGYYKVLLYWGIFTWEPRRVDHPSSINGCLGSNNNE